MAKKSEDFNLTQAIRDFQQSRHGGSARDAMEAIKKSHPSEKINEGTFKSTFYKLASGGKKKVVKKRKPGRVVAGHGGAEHIMKAGLNFIRLAGDVESAREWLVGLEELIETAKHVD
jgi:hypothetical protein